MYMYMYIHIYNYVHIYFFIQHYEHTPLIVACMHENVKMVQQLLHKLTPAEINIQDKVSLNMNIHVYNIQCTMY